MFSYIIKTLCLLPIFTLVQAQLIPEYFTPEKSSFKEVSRTYSEYKNSISFKPQSQVVFRNLDEHLKIYSSCLIHIINYDRIDLKPLSNPIVLSRYDVLMSTYLVHGDFGALKKYVLSHRTQIYPIEKLPANHSIPVIWCKRNFVYMGCTGKIPFKFLSSTSKPWTCEAHLYLFPPNDPAFYKIDKASNKISLLIPASFKTLFWNMKDEKGYEYGFSNSHIFMVTRRRYDVLVTKDRQNNFIKYWKNSLTAYTEKRWDIITTTCNVLLVLQLSQKLRSKNFPNQIFEIIESLYLIQRNDRVTNLNFPKTQQILNDKISQVKILPEDYSYVFTGTIQSLKKTYFLNGKPIPKLENIKALNDVIDLNTGSLENALFEIEFRLLGAVFNNVTMYVYPFYSCPKNPTTFCDDYIVPELSIVPSGKYEYGHLMLHEKNMRFVSCGPSDTENLSLGRLLGIFDSYVWVAIPLCILIPSIVSSIFVTVDTFLLKARNLKLSENNLFGMTMYCFMAYVSPLLEQGDPFSNKLLKPLSLRWLVILYLFSISILSNLFKQENITQLTLPRAIVPLDTFELLTSQNFKIYTRAVALGGWTSLNLTKFPIQDPIPYFVEKSFLSMIRNSKEKFGHSTSLLIKSELFHYLCESMYAQILLKRHIECPSSYMSHLNGTKLLPFWNDILYPTQSCNLFDTNDSCEAQSCPCDILGPCNNTALFLPELEAIQKYHELKKKRLSAFISKQTISGGYYSLMFGRWVSPIILKRLDGLQASGLLNWWSKFVGEFIPRMKFRHYEDHKVSSVTLSGNILMVFYILLAGFGLSLTSIISEHLITFAYNILSLRLEYSGLKILLSELWKGCIGLRQYFRWKRYIFCRKCFY